MTAYTYSQILSKMKEEYKNKSGFEADDASDIGIRLSLLCGQLYSLSSNISFIGTQLFADTATGDYLDMHASMRGLQRIQTTKAHGTVRFSVTSAAAADITVPKGTICATSGTLSTQYTTLADAVLKAGSTYADAEVSAVRGGSSSNAAIGAVKVMINPPQGIESVKNISAITGGSNSESDENLRLRIKKSYMQMSNGANAQYYIEKTLENPKVKSANLISGVRGTGTIDVYFDTAETDSSAVSALENEITDTLTSAREIGIDVAAKCCEYIKKDVTVHIKVSKDYDQNVVISECQSAVADYFENLKVGDNFILAKLCNKIFEIKGIENCHFVTPKEDTSISGKSKLTLNLLSVLNVL